MVSRKLVEDRLIEWGELDIVTDAGVVAELHAGDVEFEAEALTFEDPDGEQWDIDFSSIESMSRHRSHIKSLP